MCPPCPLDQKRLVSTIHAHAAQVRSSRSAACVGSNVVCRIVSKMYDDMVVQKEAAQLKVERKKTAAQQTTYKTVKIWEGLVMELFRKMIAVHKDPHLSRETCTYDIKFKPMGQSSSCWPLHVCAEHATHSCECTVL
eukprot:gnl/TRDRNA2_/TRDRNA2_210521_c0_seq1.p1 gnl/TRDRNA2_/TRDRNA2_210521_c0~~gnl/TRDRNA2_/TRDRNA2_210521_c0_seq1.p1  ORF type:complete len:137 (-),score=15.15 gnl/TRDRNA2_/TRDRNA2_210521_c0_seq1:40-450(-)